MKIKVIFLIILMMANVFFVVNSSNIEDTISYEAVDTIKLFIQPDTQVLTTNSHGLVYGYEHLFNQTRYAKVWGADMVVHLGDLVEVNTVVNHWNAINQSFAILTNDSMPYSVLAGNHDLSYNADNTINYTVYNTYFSKARIERDNPFFMGSFDDTTVEHSYYRITKGSLSVISISLSWNFDLTVLDWVENIIQSYPDDLIILSTHRNLKNNGYWDGIDVYYRRYRSFSSYSNVVLYLNGHAYGSGVKLYNGALHYLINYQSTGYFPNATFFYANGFDPRIQYVGLLEITSLRLKMDNYNPYLNDFYMMDETERDYILQAIETSPFISDYYTHESFDYLISDITYVAQTTGTEYYYPTSTTETTSETTTITTGSSFDWFSFPEDEKFYQQTWFWVTSGVFVGGVAIIVFSKEEDEL